MKPDLKEEKKLWQKGYKRVVGVDEVGRGPLAGPVVACAVSLDLRKLSRKKFKDVNDSKKLSPKQREKLYKFLIADPAVEWGIGQVSEKKIDKINILESTKLAMLRAVQKISQPDFLILDGNMVINSAVPQKAIIKGDEKVLSCACASVIAKVTRDRLMEKHHKKDGRYGFNRHKGYGTKMHRERLRRYGPSKIHRQSFTLI
ncbi:MAG: ribonuclease HII [Candidatus Nealsonbacteria bacterium]